MFNWASSQNSPDSSTVYREAYGRTPEQWTPSNAYGKAFSTTQLFNHPGDLWEGLKAQYGLHSAVASHAGIASTVWHETSENALYAPFITKDEQDILRAWYTVLLTDYMAIWRIFFDIFRECGDQVTQEKLEKDFLAWQGRVAVLMAQRAPCIVEHTSDGYE